MDVDETEQVGAVALGGSRDPEPSVNPAPPPYFAQKLPSADYDQTVKEITKEAVGNLVESDEYKQMMNTCSSCRACWFLNQWSMDCVECGGHALVRPCPICLGNCGQVWRRDIKMTHSFHSAYWNGTCGLPQDEQMAHFYRNVVDNDEETLLSGMEDLSAR
ncbi:protein pinocchio-like [Lineus longissimus]|uniref:protein pinocchio-like n=1 Tax=Lineus longissimus TaxID=88925 RepID=UPI002B4E0A08